MDEPTAGMDAPSRKYILDVLKAEKHNKTIVHITHFAAELGSETDYVAILRDGRLHSYKSMEEFLKENGLLIWQINFNFLINKSKI